MYRENLGWVVWCYLFLSEVHQVHWPSKSKSVQGDTQIFGDSPCLNPHFHSNRIIQVLSCNHYLCICLLAKSRCFFCINLCLLKDQSLHMIPTFSHIFPTFLAGKTTSSLGHKQDLEDRTAFAGGSEVRVNLTGLRMITGWWFGFFFPYIGNNHPNWLSYFCGLMGILMVILMVINTLVMEY